MSAAERRACLIDLACLLGAALLVIGAGIGLRDPWPADEPRFALIARDMLASGQWLIPTIGGDLYADKPPVFFWAIALALLVTGSLRIAFLLPSLLAALGTLILVHDLARRLWDREAALAADLLLLASVQFLIQARSAQIDGFLLFWTTLGLYGLARHLLLGPAWSWYAVGGLACGIGVITKGVGFLPLLALIIWPVLRWCGFPVPSRGGSLLRKALAPVAMFAGIAVWIAPMMMTVAASNDPALAAYQDEILFDQTVDRYASAWHHIRAPWYFVVNVIPALWLPGTALLPWLVPRWRGAWRERQPAVWLFLAWTITVVLFFSLSPGKRGVYVLPALPAFVLAAAPFLPDLWKRLGPQRVGAALTVLLTAACLAAHVWFEAGGESAMRLREEHGVTSTAPLALIAALCAFALVAFRPRRGLAAFAVSLWAALIVQGMWINPMIDTTRSGRAFIERLARALPPGAELGIVAYREEFLLHLPFPATNFGHRRWREDPQEMMDASRWLSVAPGRVLLVDETRLPPCFGDPTFHKKAGVSAGKTWWLVSSRMAPECIRGGDLGKARVYVPPGSGPHAGHQPKLWTLRQSDPGS